MSTFDESLKALDKAQDAIEVAEYDLNGNYILAATNRAYYAYFYCMIAMLLTKNVYSKTHQGIHGKFSELFVKPGTFSPSVAVGIKNAFNLRQEADYDLDTTITAEVAKETIEQAKEFYYLCKAYLRTL